MLLTGFCMALAAWGLGLYSMSAATTFNFLVGAAALYAVEYAAAHIGRRPVVVAGVLLMAGCASASAYVRDAFWLFVAYGGMAFGWAAISGIAITQIISRWFDAKRGLALNLPLTGASAAGFVIVPLLKLQEDSLLVRAQTRAALAEAWTPRPSTAFVAAKNSSAKRSHAALRRPARGAGRPAPSAPLRVAPSR